MSQKDRLLKVWRGVLESAEGRKRNLMRQRQYWVDRGNWYKVESIDGQLSSPCAEVVRAKEIIKQLESAVEIVQSEFFFAGRVYGL